MTDKRSQRERGRHAPAGRVAKALWPRVVELRAEGATSTEIAEAIGRDGGQVRRTLQDEWVKAEILKLQNERRAALNEEIRGTAVEAWGVLRSLMKMATKEETQLRAACEVLDRAGIKAPVDTPQGPNTPPTTTLVPDLTTPEGMATLRAELAAIPPRLLEEALESIRAQAAP